MIRVFSDLGIQNQVNDVKTPFIDQLAKEGAAEDLQNPGIYNGEVRRKKNWYDHYFKK